MECPQSNSANDAPIAIRTTNHAIGSVGVKTSYSHEGQGGLAPAPQDLRRVPAQNGRDRPHCLSARSGLYLGDVTNGPTVRLNASM